MKLVANNYKGKKAGTSVEIGPSDEVFSYLGECPRSSATPLVELPALAQIMGLGKIYIKCESERLGLGSFKALGGAFAVAKILRKNAETSLGKSILPSQLLDEKIRKISGNVTVCCATDGNHGLSVAAAAKTFGCQCVIYVHQGVSFYRKKRLRRAGARLVTVEGTYDDSVDAVKMACRSNDWLMVSDTAWPGYEDIPLDIMQGYTVLMQECIEQLGGLPTHVFLQAGVGGFAAAVSHYIKDRDPNDSCQIIVVEPDAANCLQESLSQDTIVKVAGYKPTIMSMLECHKPSSVAFSILREKADYFQSIDDAWAVRAMRQLAFPFGRDAKIVAGESGAAGIAGLMALSEDVYAWTQVGLDKNARVLCIVTEGASDPGIYREIVGLDAESGPGLDRRTYG